MDQPLTNTPPPDGGATVNEYEAKQAARRERYLALARKAEQASDASYARVRRILDSIPLGQPILVDHYSARRMRGDQARMDTGMRHAIEEQNRAKYYTRRAETMGGSISSDDPQALEKLKKELETAAQAHERMKRANRILRRRRGDKAGAVSDLQTAGFSATEAEKLFQPTVCGLISFPSFSLSNSSANMRRIQLRIRQLEQLKRCQEQARHSDTPPSETTIGQVRIIQNVLANRLQVVFPGIPAENVRRELKRSGFRWSPTAGAWQRHLSNQAKYAAERIANSLAQQSQP